MSDAPAAFALQGVTFKYGDRVALDSLGFSILPGEVFGFLGPQWWWQIDPVSAVVDTCPVAIGFGVGAWPGS